MKRMPKAVLAFYHTSLATAGNAGCLTGTMTPVASPFCLGFRFFAIMGLVFVHVASPIIETAKNALHVQKRHSAVGLSPFV